MNLLVMPVSLVVVVLWEQVPTILLCPLRVVEINDYTKVIPVEVEGEEDLEIVVRLSESS